MRDKRGKSEMLGEKSDTRIILADSHGDRKFLASYGPTDSHRRDRGTVKRTGRGTHSMHGALIRKLIIRRCRKKTPHKSVSALPANRRGEETDW